MSCNLSVRNKGTLLKRLRIVSLLKRAVCGVLLLVFGVLGSAWLLDTSLKKTAAEIAVSKSFSDALDKVTYEVNAKDNAVNHNLD
ncbi:MAG: hypothetical protein TECD_00506 [Hyphomicrobiaceae bacterium hypho_1]